MSKQSLPVGIENFKELVEKNYYFVDKTLLIAELLDNDSKVTLFTRPRRFGKTLNMSMLQYFFEDMHTSGGERVDHSALFNDLKISQAKGSYMSHMGQYPVISLTLKSAKRPTYDGAYLQLVWQIAMEYDRHSYVLKANITDSDKKLYEKLMNREGSEEEYCTSLQFLAKCLKNYYGKNVIILIDEYDVPLENSYTEGFYDDMVTFVRSLFEAALKTNNNLEFAVITGCLRISKESIFTGLNNLKVISILDKSYDEFFGFTDEEIQDMCTNLGITDNYERVKEWYDGYQFGDANIYNPWSVINYMFDHVDYPDDPPKAYWANTSSNAIVRRLIEMADESVKGDIENLITGGSVNKSIHEDITYDEVYENIDNLWNFMFFTGYFRKICEIIDETTGIKYLKMIIPNEEVRYIFRNKLMAWFDEQVKARDLTGFYSAILNKDIKTVEKELNDIMLHTISYMDADESYYHGIIAGLLTGMPKYYIKSNRETGKGRSDLMMLPVSRRKEAFIFEFKKAERVGQLEEKAKEALLQIDNRNYKTDVYDLGYDVISYYGISFCGKDCFVMCKEDA